ncbi:hypothetical protein EN45_012100 [Penicillium chrysogenum]|uniref:Uncharacterized protein n=1 Tax=Penicillium chrysogenum TaxID=5076 RepID=A0A167VZH2_PENCH|nr:hypothetical protein EN45_012100 [Penicillium chrysogenum]
MVPSPRGWLFSRLTMQMASKRVCAIVKWHSQPAERAVACVVPLPAPGRSYNGPISHGLARWAGELFLLRVQQVDHAGGIWTIVPAPGRSCNALRSQELAVARWHGSGALFLLRVQQVDHAGGIWTIVPAPGRSYNLLHSQELAVARWHGAGALFLLRVQQADHVDGMVCATVPAPGRSYNLLHSQELAVAGGGMVSLLDTQVVAVVLYCQPPGGDIPSPRGWRVVPAACPAG